MNKKFREYLLNELVSTSTINFYTTDKEVLREAIIAEYDAANLYLQMAAKVKNPAVKRVLEHVAQEEKVHIGEFETLLEKLDQEHEPSEEEGEEEIKKMKLQIWNIK